MPQSTEQCSPLSLALGPSSSLAQILCAFRPAGC